MSAPEGRSSKDASTNRLTPDPFLAGDSQMAELMRALDWKKTSVGPTETWPQSLRTVVRILLSSRYAMWMGWGDDLTFLYNDAYRQMTLGAKHPWALGKPAQEVWAEIWKDIGPRIQSVLDAGTATWDEALLLFLERSGYPEETYHTFSYSPLADDDGNVAGVFCVVMEETDRVLGERRLRVLREIAAEMGESRTPEEVFAAVEGCLEAEPHDLPFTLTYLVDPNGSNARLVSKTGISAEHPAAPLTMEANGDEKAWPIFGAIEEVNTVEVHDLASSFDDLPSGPWDKPPGQAIVVPIAQQGQARPAGAFVAGLNPYRRLDPEYHGFIKLLVGQIAAGLANASAYEEERKRAEALAEIDRVKTHFFSNVSHELRTPLTLLLAPLEDALSTGSLPDDERESLEMAERNAQRLLKLVNSLLDFSRIEAGRIDASYQPTDLSAYTADLASVFRSAVEQAGLRLVVDTPPLPDPVYVDREMWETIVMNLLSNALKFTFEGEIEIRLRRVDAHVELAVRDTGIGIASGELPRLFERFHRVEGARGRTFEGTGIGLALVRELARLHGGDVQVESTEGEGSTFTVSVPMGSAHLPSDKIEPSRDHIPETNGSAAYLDEALRWLQAEDQTSTRSTSMDEATERPSPNVRSESSARILLVDDNADMREYIGRLLGDQYDVVAVSDGIAALKEARAESPDLILTDVMMPRMDGFSLLKALRDDPDTRDVPIILLSARAGDEARIEGLEAGADDYLIKPFSARELLARVRGTLELSSLRNKSEAALRESEERLRLALDSAQFGSWDLDLRSKESPARSFRHDRIFGYGEPLAEWSYERFMEHVHPDDRDEVDRSFQEALSKGGRWDFECRIIRADGELRWIWAAGGIYRDADGNPERALGIVSDVTERKLGEQERGRLTAELHIERSRLREIFVKAPALIVTLRGPDHVFESANPLYIQLIGRENIVGKTVAEVLPEAEEQGFLDLLDQVYHTAEPFTANEMPVLIDRNGDGTRDEVFLNFVYQPLFGADGAVSGILVHGVDVTDQVRAREALRESEERFRALVTASSDVVYRMSPDWSEMRFLDGRSFIEDTLEPSRTWLAKYIHPTDHAHVMEKIGEAVRNENTFELEHRVLRADGTVGWTFSRAVPLMDAEGNIVEWFGMASDVTDRKKAEDALKRATDEIERQRRLYETILSSTPDLVYVIDLDYRFTYANDALLRMWGRTLDESVGKSLLEIGYEPWHAEMHEREIDEVVATKQPIRGEAPFPHATLGRRIYDYIFVPVLNSDGEVEAIAGTTRDVTERKKVEEALSESEERYRLALTVARQGTWSWDPDLDIVIADDRCREIFGLDPEAPLTLSDIAASVHPDDWPRIEKALHTAILPDGPGSYAEEFRFVHPDGSVRWTVSRGQTLFEGEGEARRPALMLGTVLDISERKRTEMLFAGQKQALELITQGAPLDEVLNVLIQTIEDQSGGAMIGSVMLVDHDGKHLRHGAAPSLPDSYNRAIDGIEIGPTVGSFGTAAHFQKRIVASDIASDPLWANFRELALAHGLRACWSTPILSAGREILGTFAIYYREPGDPDPQDLQLVEFTTRTAGIAIERKRTEQERERLFQALVEEQAQLRNLNATLEQRVADRTADLERANIELRRSNRELQDFAYVASHDLQEPLRKISTFTDLLRMEYGEVVDETGHAYMQRMQDAALRMLGLLRDLLEFSRVVTHGETFQHVDLNALVANVLSDLEVSILESGGTVRAETLPSIEADPMQMRQLFQNLIGNALKFRRAGVPPVVRISGDLQEGGDSEDPRGGAVLRIVIADNGIGFEEQYLDRIFAPFQRLHGRSSYPGTGMGLAICRRIVERHQGAITARSTLGKGSTFILTLPVRQSS